MGAPVFWFFKNIIFTYSQHNIKSATLVSILEKWLEKYSQKASLAEEITMQWEVSVCFDIPATCYYIHERKKKKKKSRGMTASLLVVLIASVSIFSHCILLCVAYTS